MLERLTVWPDKSSSDLHSECKVSKIRSSTLCCAAFYWSEPLFFLLSVIPASVAAGPPAAYLEIITNHHFLALFSGGGGPRRKIESTAAVNKSQCETHLKVVRADLYVFVLCYFEL